MKNNFKKHYILAILGLLFVSSCDNNEDVTEESIVANSILKVDELYNSNSTLKRQFGKALMLSLNESKALRDLIKEKSLEMFDNDYDVLYQMIKNEKLENNVTVRESILKNIGDENLLNLIEINNPTLTIFVPELPENSFSAKLWNTETEVPKVAIRLSTSNDIPIINQDGTEEIIEARYTPGFPIIVIKDNERVVVDRNKEFSKLTTRTLKSVNNVEFKFLDDCFDSSKNVKKETSRIIPSVALDSKIIDAYNIYSNADGWHRDYIYYGITPNSPKGPFKYDFQETIKTFSLQGDPTAAYNKIADQTGDPILRTQIPGSKNNPFFSAWSGGNFEFKVRIIVNGKNGVGSEIIKYFNATGDDLFDVSSVRTVRFPNYLYTYKINALKSINLNIPIFNWDLDQYASTIKIDIEEIDLTETTILTESRSVEFASNFSVEASTSFFEELVKVGLKYGTSQKVVKTSTIQRTFTQGNDLLGDVIVNFADNVIISIWNNICITREYNSGLYSITVEPTKVQ